MEAWNHWLNLAAKDRASWVPHRVGRAIHMQILVVPALPLEVVLLLVQAGLLIHISMVVRLLHGMPLPVHQIRMEMAARHQPGTRRPPILIHHPMVEKHLDGAEERLLGIPVRRLRILMLLVEAQRQRGTRGGAMHPLQGPRVVRVYLLADGVWMIGFACSFLLTN